MQISRNCTVNVAASPYSEDRPSDARTGAGRRLTLRDFGPGFTLLKLHSGVDADGIAELYEAKLALIRPDQHTVLRGGTPPPANTEAIIDCIHQA